MIIDDNRDYEEIQEEGIKKLKEKYSSVPENGTLFKSKIGILSNKVHFRGYSVIDGSPIYETFCFNSIQKTLEDKDIELSMVKYDQVSNMILPNEDMDFIII